LREQNDGRFTVVQSRRHNVGDAWAETSVFGILKTINFFRERYLEYLFRKHKRPSVSLDLYDEKSPRP